VLDNRGVGCALLAGLDNGKVFPLLPSAGEKNFDGFCGGVGWTNPMEDRGRLKCD